MNKSETCFLLQCNPVSLCTCGNYYEIQRKNVLFIIINANRTPKTDKVKHKKKKN